MRSYQIYLIEDEFARHYFGREKIFFNLFLEYIQSSNWHKDILQKQIEYITKKIPASNIHYSFEQSLQRKQGYLSQNGVYYLKVKSNSKATVYIHDQSIILKAEGDFDAETTFFECIRKCEASFLAIDFENKRYGWLKPIKERKYG
ncbi:MULTISPECIES: sporulation inhibitor of replication protein SirA [Bacillaceae]|uniref:Sporulation inhibitor of replication protein SirA n=1 Tax=Peribacillus huizhouensis TaxID=1501239 RepID=A0ABR6CW55_9BACI|nr:MULTISPECIES: sporulation inhibitor of replication protein SirA [Bacillaceae]MBA9029251.1 hypothetical protein [Peribacillus huizhouensis]